MTQREICFIMNKTSVAVWPWPATKGHAVTLLPLPPRWGGAENGKKKAKTRESG